MESNEKDKVVFVQPKQWEERRGIANQCCERLNMKMPCVVDTIDDQVDEMYAGWPERLFVIMPDGKIAYAGKQGPFGFNPDEVKRWLKRNVGRPSRIQ